MLDEQVSGYSGYYSTTQQENIVAGVSMKAIALFAQWMCIDFEDVANCASGLLHDEANVTEGTALFLYMTERISLSQQMGRQTKSRPKINLGTP